MYYVKCRVHVCTSPPCFDATISLDFKNRALYMIPWHTVPSGIAAGLGFGFSNPLFIPTLELFFIHGINSPALQALD